MKATGCVTNNVRSARFASAVTAATSGIYFGGTMELISGNISASARKLSTLEGSLNAERAYAVWVSTAMSSLQFEQCHRDTNNPENGQQQRHESNRCRIAALQPHSLAHNHVDVFLDRANLFIHRPYQHVHFRTRNEVPLLVGQSVPELIDTLEALLR